MHLTLTDNMWALPVESVLKKEVLGSFIVGCTEDLTALRAIQAECRCSVTVYVMRLRDHVYRMGDLPSDSILTFARVLRADDPNIMNTLIDHFRIQGLALVPTRQDADRLLAARERGVREVYAADGSRLIERNGSVAFFPARNKVAWFGIDFDRAIRDAKEQLSAVNPKIAELEGQRQATERRRNSAQDQVRAAQGKLNAEARALNRARIELDDLRSAAAHEEKPPDVSEMEHQLEEMRADMARAEKERDDAKVAAEAAREEAAPLHEEMAVATSEVERQRNRLEEAREKLDKPMSVGQRTAARLRESEAGLEKARSDAARAVADLERLNHELEADVSKARAICPEERRPSQPPEELSHEIMAREEEIRKERQRRRSVQEVDDELRDAGEQLEITEKGVASVRVWCGAFRKSIAVREVRMEEIRTKITKEARVVFALVMKKRRCKGDLEIDHEREMLEVQVQLNYDGPSRPSQGQHAMSNTKTLSGGERSFSTFALLIALWQTIESPFCALDEFDVYMDSLNRKRSARVLIEFAATYKRRQYIIITPQTDLEVDATQLVRIHRLRAPIRGMGAIPFASVSNAAPSTVDE
jgi:chromosome segregation ATPase